MSGIVPFNFEGAAVRIVDVSGEPWFVGKDVAELLGYTNPNKAMADHCKGVTKRYPLQTAGGMQEIRILSEPDVLRLIVRSTLPEAVRIERWIFEEVLPSIRKTGGYMVASPEETEEQLVMRAMGVLQATVERQKTQLAETMPKAEALDRIANTDGSMSITEAAKTLQVQPKVLFVFLRTHEWIYRRPGASADLGYQTKLNACLLEHKTTVVSKPDGTEKTVTQVRVTPKGLAQLAKIVPGVKGPLL